MKISGSPETVRYIGFEQIEKTGIANAGFTVKWEQEWSYRLIAKEIGIEPEMTVHPIEAHTCNVKYVDASFGGNGTMTSGTLNDIDGLITDVPGLALCLIMSDCAAVYLVDTKNRCIGISHSGRSGTQANIAAETVRMMSEKFGTKPQDVVAAISPCICKDCYEVDALTGEKFAASFQKEWLGEMMSKKNGKAYLNIAAAIRLQLEEIGVKTVQMPEYCTCHNENFFSYRGGDGVESNCAWLMLNKE